MDKAYFIFLYAKQGNIGNWHFEKLAQQPENGFTHIYLAEAFLEDLKIESWWKYGFTILPIYSPKK